MCIRIFTMAIVSLYLFMMVLHINGRSKQWLKYQVNALFSPTFCVPSDKSHGIYGLLLHRNQRQKMVKCALSLSLSLCLLSSLSLVLSLSFGIKSMSICLCIEFTQLTPAYTLKLSSCASFALHFVCVCAMCVVRGSEQSNQNQKQQ